MITEIESIAYHLDKYKILYVRGMGRRRRLCHGNTKRRMETMDCTCKPQNGRRSR